MALHTTAIDQVVAGLIVFGMLNLAYLVYATGIVVAREDGVLRRWLTTLLVASPSRCGSSAGTRPARRTRSGHR